MSSLTYQTYQTKTILNAHKHCDGGWFWVKYSAFPYLGCEWGCEYCYWRDEKYNPHKASRDKKVLEFDDAFSQYIKVKENAPELLRKALKNKPIDLIYLDNYQPIDSKYQYTRKMLEVCLKLGFPVFINEKSLMLLRDIDVLKKINKKSYLNVGWSIITSRDDKIRKVFEPKVPPVQARFEAMQKLAKEKILTGTVFMPILPFVYDDEKNIEEVIQRTKECGGQYVLDAGLTLWGYCGTYFYKVLEKHNPDLVPKYKKLYSNSKLLAEYTAKIHSQVLKYCQKYNLTPYIPRPVSFYPKELQNNKKIAEKFYLEARELQMSGRGGYKEWAYRKGAWALDDLNENIQKIYQNEGLSGIMQIKGIGEKLADKIEQLLKAEGLNKEPRREVKNMSDKSLAPVCGIYCGACKYFEKQCQGCGNVKGKPFWTTQMKVKVCPLYDCCVSKKQLEYCSLCDEFPCGTFTGFYDPSLSPEEAKKSVLARQNELLRRKEIGTEKWLEEKEVFKK